MTTPSTPEKVMRRKWRKRQANPISDEQRRKRAKYRIPLPVKD